MRVDASKAKLRDIQVDKVARNEQNPRIYFRQSELSVLQESIRQHGIQVPVSVYARGDSYILIDGERRWRCALKLNLKTMPALVQEEPTALTNVLLMFNIHALREQWDLLTIAMKLPYVIELIRRERQKDATEAELATQTGLSRSVIRRSRLLMNLPEMYREQMLEELHKPKARQQLTEDFFIEMERALKTVERAMPEIIAEKNEVRDVLIEKYQKGVIKDIIDLRHLPKIAKAERVQVDPTAAQRSLQRVFSRNSYSIRTAYDDTVAYAYSEKDLLGKVESLSARLEELKQDEVDESLAEALGRLRELLGRLLRRSR